MFDGRILVLAVLAAWFSIFVRAALAQDAPVSQQGLKEIQGVWVPQVVVVNGQARRCSAENADEGYAIRGDVCTTLMLLLEDEFTDRQKRRVSVDTTRQPHTIDFIDGDEVVRGIYKLNGRVLTIVEAPPGEERPESFKLTADSPNTLRLLMSRQPADREALARQLRGKWRLVGIMQDGEEAEFDGGRRTRYVDPADQSVYEGVEIADIDVRTKDEDVAVSGALFVEWRDLVGQACRDSWSLVSDTSRIPLELDWLTPERTGVRRRGIWQIEDGRLFVAFGAPLPENTVLAGEESDRPLLFESPKGSPVTVGVYERLDAPAFQTYVSKQGRYSVEMVGKPLESVSDVEGTKLTVTKSLVHKGLLFEVAHYDDPLARKYASPQAFLKDILDGSYEAPVRNKTEYLWGKNETPGREITAVDSEFHVRERAFLAGERVYRVKVVAAAEDDLTCNAAERFLRSFQIDGK